MEIVERVSNESEKHPADTPFVFEGRTFQHDGEFIFIERAGQFVPYNHVTINGATFSTDTETFEKGLPMAAKPGVLMVGDVLIPHDPVALNTKFGAVAVYGSEYIDKKTLLIMQAALNTNFVAGGEDHLVRTIVFRVDGRPHWRGKPALSIADPDTFGIAVNLMQHFSSSFEQCLNVLDHGRLISLQAIYHQMLLTSLFHEFHHIQTWGPDSAHRTALDKELAATGQPTPIWKKTEKDAEDFAREMLAHMAKKYDVEPGPMEDSTFLATQFDEMCRGNESDIIAQQRWLARKHVFMHVPETDKCHETNYRTFKEFIRLQYDLGMTDKAWDAMVPRIEGEPTVVEQLQAHNPEPTLQQQVAAAVSATMGSALGNAEPDEGWVDLSETPHFSGMEYADFCEDTTGEMDDDGEEDDPMVPSTGAVMALPKAGRTPAPAPKPVPKAAPPAPAAVPPTVAFAPIPDPGTMVKPHGYTPPSPEAIARVATHSEFTREEELAAIFSVYNKIYNHLFQHCGRPHHFDAVDRADHQFGGAPFNIENVWRMPIELSEIERNVVLMSDCLGENGKWSPRCPTGSGLLRGQIALKGLPQYKLYISLGGKMIVRLVVPQHPQNNSNTAKQAAAGNKIMYVKDGHDKFKGTGANTLLWSCKNGVWNKCTK